MEEQRELERRVRSMYELTRSQDPRVLERKTPAAALESLLRAAELEEPSGPDGEPPKVHSLSGAFTPNAARRALAVAGRPFMSGALVVTDGTKDLGLLFTPSGVKALALGFKFPSLAKRLIEKGRVATAQLNRLESAVKRHRGEQEALVALGIAADMVGEVAAETVGQVLLDALFWSDPQFEAVAGEADPEGRDRRDVDVLTLSSKNAKAVVQGVVDRLSELAAVHRSLPTLRVPLSEGPKVSEKSGSLSGRAVEILTVVSRRAGVLASEVPDRMAEGGQGKLPLHVLAKEVHELVAKGLLVAGKPGTVEERVRPPEDGLGPIARRLRLAKVLYDAGDRRSAARHLSRCGTDLLGRGRGPEAVRCLAAAHALHGEDLEAHDGYVKALLACDRKDEARAEAEALVRRYLDTRLPGRARRAVARSLQEREETPLLLLQLEALLALGEGRAIADAGERIVTRLRQAGLRREAQELADALADHAADAPGRDRILRAGGVSAGSPIVGRLAVLLVAALAIGLVPAVQGLRARTAYARTHEDARSLLKIDPLNFDGVQRLFEPMAARSGAIGDAARKVVTRAREHGEDWATLLNVKRAMAQSDVDLVLQRCADAETKTASMAELIKRLEQQASDRRATAVTATQKFSELVARKEYSEAYACAKQLMKDFPDAPAVLTDLQLPLVISSPTPGAALKWNKAAFPQAMPFDAWIPLFEGRHIEVSAPGYETHTRILTVAEMDGPEVRVTLRPTGGGPAPEEVAPPPANGEPPAVTIRDGQARPGTDGRELPRFTQALRALEGVNVPAGLRARVDAQHEVRQGQVVLVSVQITIEERQQNGTWTLDGRPVTVQLPGPLSRGQAVTDSVRSPPPVGPLEATSGFNEKWLRDHVQRAVTAAVERRRQQAPPPQTTTSPSAQQGGR